MNSCTSPTSPCTAIWGCYGVPSAKGLGYLRNRVDLQSMVVAMHRLIGC